MKSYIQQLAAGPTLSTQHSAPSTRFARVAKWQTQQTQNLPGRKPRVGSSPTSGTKLTQTRRRLMNRTVSIALVLVLAVPLLAVADEERPSHRNPGRGPALHYFVAADRILDAGELEAD